MVIKFPKARAEALVGIPGLKVYEEQGVARGSVDAIAAARLALGGREQPPPMPAGVEPSPGRSVLRSYQRLGVSWLANTIDQHGAAILADDMGLGKTLQVLTCITSTSQASDRVLVLCPAAAIETWREELTKWGVQSVAVLDSSGSAASKRAWETARSCRWVVCSYDHRIVERAVEKAFVGEVPTWLVLDEAHRLRGRKSKRSDVLTNLRPMVERVVAMTATPQMSRPRDLYQLLRILYDYRFGSQWDFDRRYCGAQPGKWGGLVYPKRGSFNADELALRLRYYMLRREKRDVATELPPMTIQVRWIDPTNQAKKLFMQAQLNIGKATLHEAALATLAGKVDEAIALAKESRRFVLATWLRSHAQQFHRVLNEDHDTPCVLITGEMTTPKRADAIARARSTGCGIVATTDSISESLNLQGVASIGILHALDWVPLKLAQLFARLHRLGQTDPVTWYLLAMKESVDRVIVDTQVSKLEQYRAIMGDKGHREVRLALADESEIMRQEKKALAEIYAAMG